MDAASFNRLTDPNIPLGHKLNEILELSMLDTLMGFTDKEFEEYIDEVRVARTLARQEKEHTRIYKYTECVIFAPSKVISGYFTSGGNEDCYYYVDKACVVVKFKDGSQETLTFTDYESIRKFVSEQARLYVALANINGGTEPKYLEISKDDLPVGIEGIQGLLCILPNEAAGRGTCELYYTCELPEGISPRYYVNTVKGLIGSGRC